MSSKDGYTGNELVTGTEVVFTLDLRKNKLEMLIKGINKKYEHSIKGGEYRFSAILYNLNDSLKMVKTVRLEEWFYFKVLYWFFLK